MRMKLEAEEDGETALSCGRRRESDGNDALRKSLNHRVVLHIRDSYVIVLSVHDISESAFPESVLEGHTRWCGAAACSIRAATRRRHQERRQHHQSLMKVRAEKEEYIPSYQAIALD